MKSILIASIAAATMATSAFAYTDASESMVNSVREILTTVGIEETMVEDLSDAQIASIYLAGTSEMDEGQKEQEIKKFLTDNQQDAEASTTGGVQVNVDGGGNTMTQIVDDLLRDHGFEVNASTLTDAQLAAIYLAATSSDSESREKEKIEAILQ